MLAVLTVAGMNEIIVKRASQDHFHSTHWDTPCSSDQWSEDEMRTVSDSVWCQAQVAEICEMKQTYFQCRQSSCRTQVINVYSTNKTLYTWYNAKTLSSEGETSFTFVFAGKQLTFKGIQSTSVVKKTSIITLMQFSGCSILLQITIYNCVVD